MTKQELIKLIEALPDNADIVVDGYHCDIMGEYAYNNKPEFRETEAVVSKQGDYQATVSNYANGKKKKVWVLE